MFGIDFNEERAFEERKDLLEQQDRERRGVHFCDCCGKETKEDVHCDGPGCKVYGCKKCMFYDAPSIGWYCSEDCLGKMLSKQLEHVYNRMQTVIAQRDMLFEACTLAACSDAPRELIQYHLAQVARQVKEMQ